jgi:hypothetical protein
MVAETTALRAMDGTRRPKESARAACAALRMMLRLMEVAPFARA